MTGGSQVGLNQTVRGTINRNLMHVSDWMPTLCEIAGCNHSALSSIDGVSAWKHISQPAVQSSRSEIVHDVYKGIDPPW